MHILMYGPEGSGKGTQATLLSEALRIPILTSGDLVRDAATNDKGPLGDVCRKALSEGQYVNDTQMYGLWKNRLDEKGVKSDWIMDGFPRNIEQVKFLEQVLSSYGQKIDVVIYLNISEEESITRLVKRARPLHPGSTELHDSPDRIKKRLAVYKAGQKDLLAYYRDRGVLREISAEKSVEEVHTLILNQVHV
ncbi:MAG TPA: nucleoside monophosphate kinase [Patescibacteria group bacterium]|nr:nucleoside monophosphate kinase [Patescibacteria group bacterium]